MIDARRATQHLILHGARFSGLAALASPFMSGAGSILMLHRVTDAAFSPLGLNDILGVSPRFLDELLADLRARSIDLVSMDEVLSRLAAPRPGRFAAITADDAYLDNLREALPVLEAHAAPMTIYVSPGLSDGSVLPWWEEVEHIVAAADAIDLPAALGGGREACDTQGAKQALAQRLMEAISMQVPEADQQEVLDELHRGAGSPARAERRFMNWDELRQIARHPLVTLGAHTLTHARLARLDEDAARSEMVGSADEMERALGQRPAHFAYPYGDPSAAAEREVRLASEARFVSAVTTRHGVLQAGHAQHLHALPRISVNGLFQSIGHVRTLMSGITTPLANGGRRLVTL